MDCYASMAGYTLKIVSATNVTVFTSPINLGKSEINLQKFGKGTYFVYLIDGNGVTTDVRKIILQ